MSNDANIEPILVTYPEAAALLGMGRSTLYELTAAGEIPVVKIGRAVRIPVRSLREFVARLEAGGQCQSS